ncbi:hypothetical protein [Pseudomonas amygdali]|nr:hypothetical protein [Pseudomonas amygdali]KPC17388.1 Uncharacterized protein AC499_0590 [Pseudomonas amygdali pv. lachrymans]
MSDIQARHRFRQDYKTLSTLMYDMASDGRRFDQGDFNTLRPMLIDLCDQADASPGFAQAIAHNEGVGLLRWYIGQWPKRELNSDGSPEQNALAEGFASLAVRIVESLKIDLGWETKNLIGIDKKFDAYLVKRLLEREIGLFSYDLSRSEYYEDESSPAQSKGYALSEVLSNLASAERQDLLTDLVAGINEFAAIAPESISDYTRVALFMSCFRQQREPAAPAFKSTLGALLAVSDMGSAEKLIKEDTDNFYSAMINAAASGLREEVEPLIQHGLDSNYCPNTFKQLLTGIERYTHVDVASVMISFSHKIAANDPDRDHFRDILMCYYMVSDAEVVPDQIEFTSSDYHFFAPMLKNEYSAYYDPQTQKLNMTNVKALMCEYLGQHPSMVKQMAGVPELAPIVKTLPYWHDHNFAVDLGL